VSFEGLFSLLLALLLLAPQLGLSALLLPLAFLQLVFCCVHRRELGLVLQQCLSFDGFH